MVIPTELRYNNISDLIKQMTDVVFEIREKILEMGICVKVSCKLRTYNTGAGKDLTGHREIDNEFKCECK